MLEQPKESKSPILRLSQKEFADMVETGEIEIVNPKEQRLVASETKAWETFLGKHLETPIPPPPKDLLRTMEKAKDIGWTKAEAHYLPKMELQQTSDIPGWTEKPNAGYWKKIQEKDIADNAAVLPGNWIIIDGVAKPNFQINSSQLYADDPFGDALTQLRNQKKIDIPETYRETPFSSRFVISPQELESHVLPAISKLVGVSSNQVRLPKAIEFNILGNIFHPEWGQTDTLE